MTPYGSKRIPLSAALIGLIFTIIATVSFVRCGKSKITPFNKSVDGLPASWDGSSDYDFEGWGFSQP